VIRTDLGNITERWQDWRRIGGGTGIYLARLGNDRCTWVEGKVDGRQSSTVEEDVEVDNEHVSRVSCDVSELVVDNG
jgi:hypothetical protein